MQQEVLHNENNQITGVRFFDFNDKGLEIIRAAFGAIGTQKLNSDPEKGNSYIIVFDQPLRQDQEEGFKRTSAMVRSIAAKK